jgi:hypothetical protein
MKLSDATSATATHPTTTVNSSLLQLLIHLDRGPRQLSSTFNVNMCGSSWDAAAIIGLVTIFVMIVLAVAGWIVKRRPGGRGAFNLFQAATSAPY